jgi:hypothetical protein
VYLVSYCYTCLVASLLVSLFRILLAYVFHTHVLSLSLLPFVHPLTVLSMHAPMVRPCAVLCLVLLLLLAPQNNVFTFQCQIPYFFFFLPHRVLIIGLFNLLLAALAQVGLA